MSLLMTAGRWDGMDRPLRTEHGSDFFSFGLIGLDTRPVADNRTSNGPATFIMENIVLHNVHIDTKLAQNSPHHFQKFAKKSD